MRPLQRRLRRAGLHGLVWQAGLGNPVATGNFLRDDRVPGRWHWIDLESGVPAVAPGPVSALTFYLPWTLSQGRPLFDDVDVDRLRAYVEQRHVRLRRLLGETDWRRLCSDIAALERHQRAWRAQG